MLKKNLKKHIMVKSYYKHHRDIIWHDFYATINLSAIFFDIRTHLNDNGFLIKQRRQQRFLNEHHLLLLLISSAIQWNLFHRLHFSLKLSKSFISMTDFCATLNFSAKLTKSTFRMFWRRNKKRHSQPHRSKIWMCNMRWNDIYPTFFPIHTMHTLCVLCVPKQQT